MVLREETPIRTSPDRVARFFDGMAENYTRWHPDHHAFEWVDGRGVAEGVVCAFDETVGGQRKRMMAVYTRVEPGRHMELAPVSRLLRLFLPRMLFRVEPDGDGCRFIQEVHVRIGPLAARLNRKQLDAVRRHMREEGENLKAILEEHAAPQPAPAATPPPEQP